MPDALPQTTNPGRARIWWEQTARVFASPVSGSEQRLDIWGRWQLVFGYLDVPYKDAAPLLAFFEDKGLGTAFTVLHTLARSPTPVWAYLNGKVKLGGQTGKSLNTDGWSVTPGTTIFNTGDFVELAGTSQVVRMTVDIVATDGDNATLQFAQTLRSSPADNTDVIVENIKFTVVLNAPVIDDTDADNISSFQAEMREDV